MKSLSVASAHKALRFLGMAFGAFKEAPWYLASKYSSVLSFRWKLKPPKEMPQHSFCFHGMAECDI